MQRSLPAAAVVARKQRRAAPRGAGVITIRVAAVSISAVIAGVVARKQRWPSGYVAAVGPAAVIARVASAVSAVVARVAAVVAGGCADSCGRHTSAHHTGTIAVRSPPILPTRNSRDAEGSQRATDARLRALD